MHFPFYPFGGSRVGTPAYGRRSHEQGPKLMATLPGRCINDLYCTVATTGEIVHVPAEGRFVCPHCSKTLVPPNAPLRTRARGRSRGRGVGGTPGLLMGLAGMAGGLLLGAFIFGDASGRIILLSREVVQIVPTANAAALAQPEPIYVQAGFAQPASAASSIRHRRHADATLAAALLH